ncbi:hypothetical protein BDA96_08G198100 [Sorghum bicolor]|uniref:Pre-rRNA-processing protein TSR2 homolog n=1 Tax=Sorghum bicolor TaxID=4558 RepID=A0A921U856_SORBI|nr:hypothetical protein BDA96_08G198100 [Sorghum bicolor]
MASTSSSGGGVLSDESAAAAAMSECIGLLFGRWTALQLAVRNRWGGRDSQAKADQLASSVLSWFTRNAARGLYGGTGPLDQDELEELLYDGMDESFNADIEDGSVEEVTKHLMIMYTRCLRQNYSYIDKLRKTRLAGSAITQRKEVLGGYDSSSDDDENPRSDEDDDEAGPNPKPPKPVPDADGWNTVPSRRRSK